ncbi:MAG: cytochrome-c oxidase, cbb3-type subunit III, partial [Azonexus sp.]
MSDFVSGFWNVYVIVIVLGSIFACAVLLYVQGKAKFTPGKTMGHVWDETLEEYNNPMPKWWSWLFVITVIFALVYLSLYPGLGSFKGMLGWTSIGQYKIERERMDASIQPMYDKYQAMDVKALAADKQAMETGKRLYLTYCMQCHGADGRGAKGFPNLTDSDWLYGGEPELIKQTIADGRMGVMPPHAQLGADTIKDLANYVRSLSGLPNDSVRAAKGKEAFTSAGCVGCHGP